MVEEGEEPVPGHAHLQPESTDGVLSAEGEGQSVASDDSFHSTVEIMELGGVAAGENELYMSAMELVVKGGVQCRNVRYGAMRGRGAQGT